MFIKSSTNNTTIVKIFKIMMSSYYIKAYIVGMLFIMTVINTQVFSWGNNFGVMVTLPFILWLTIGLFDPKCFDFRQFILLIVMLFIGASPGTIVPMMHDYYHSERIDTIIPIEPHTVLFNDATFSIVVIFENNSHPYIKDFVEESYYTKLKSMMLDNQVSVLKKNMKHWTDDKVIVRYVIGDFILS